MPNADSRVPVQILLKEVTLNVGNGLTLSGQLEYFQSSRALTIVSEETSMPRLLSVPRIEAGAAHARLAHDEILLADWVELHGITAALTGLGIISATGEVAEIGMFRLRAPIVRVLGAPADSDSPVVGVCDRCDLPVPVTNDAALFDALVRGDTAPSSWGKPRHLLATEACPGSPSRAQYLEGQPRDSRGFGYREDNEAAFRAAHAELLEVTAP